MRKCSSRSNDQESQKFCVTTNLICWLVDSVTAKIVIKPNPKLIMRHGNYPAMLVLPRQQCDEAVDLDLDRQIIMFVIFLFIRVVKL